jgi:hypothetical protein
MVRKADIRNLAYGIASSFNSRNNDLEGYWALGKLCLYAKTKCISSIRLDLLRLTSTPETTEFDTLMHNYQFRLNSFKQIHALPSNWLSQAEVEINFDPEYNEEMNYWRSAFGNPYSCTVSLSRELSKPISIRIGGNCRPHDPNKENKRSS